MRHLGDLREKPAFEAEAMGFKARDNVNPGG
jgi:hypothetical protein